MFSIAPSILWLIFGILLITLEFAQLPGIGFLFLGLGSVSTSIMVNYWQEQTLLTQFAYFGIFSISWFAILWYPLKSFMSDSKNKNVENTFDIIGSHVVVKNKDIKNDDIGEVLWCGTIMKAMLEKNSKVDIAKVGDSLIVSSVKGNILICSTVKN